jgi:hypothetical protein
MRGIKDPTLNVCILFLFNIAEKLNYFPVMTWPSLWSLFLRQRAEAHIAYDVSSMQFAHQNSFTMSQGQATTLSPL